MAKKLGILFGIVFVIVGLLGFISNPIVGANGIFLTDTLHNIVHLLVGVILLVAAKSHSASVLWLKIFGVVYLLLAVLGFLTPDLLNSIVAANTADAFLHLVLGIILVWAGWGSKSASMMGQM